MTNIIKVGIVGLGTIGKRVAETIMLQDDMELTGVVFRHLNVNALAAKSQNMPVFLQDIREKARFTQSGIQIDGDINNLLEQVHIVVDCTPRGQAERNIDLYRSYQLPVILQGGEREHVGLTCNSFVNLGKLKQESIIRIGSCNTTGIVRILCALQQQIEIQHVFVALVRCATDPDKSNKGIVNGLTMSLAKSHHTHDVNLLLPNIQLYTTAIAAPMTHGHLLMFVVDIGGEATLEEIKTSIAEHPRIEILPSGYSQNTSSIEGYYDQRKRGDRPFVIVIEDSIELEGEKLYFTASVHMEAIVIPDTIDAIRAKFSTLPLNEIIYKTDKTLGIEKKWEAYHNR